jgi:hypothetical protein
MTWKVITNSHLATYAAPQNQVAEEDPVVTEATKKLAAVLAKLKR